jgi:hypothetical protein
VDALTGPMVIARNDLAVSTGTYPGMCGPQRIAGVAINIAPAARPYLPRPLPAGTSAAQYCILNYNLVTATPPPPEK